MSSSWLDLFEIQWVHSVFKGIIHDHSRKFKWPLFSRGIKDIFSNFAPYFAGNEENFAPKYPWFRGHIFISSPHYKESRTFFLKKYPYFYHFKGASEFYPYFTGEMRTTAKNLNVNGSPKNTPYILFHRQFLNTHNFDKGW